MITFKSSNRKISLDQNNASVTPQASKNSKFKETQFAIATPSKYRSLVAPNSSQAKVDMKELDSLIASMPHKKV